MNIIFLDMEGMYKYRDTYEKMYEEYIKAGINSIEIDENKVERLKELVDETNSRIVLSSSWRSMGRLNEKKIVPGTKKLIEFLDILKKYDLTIYDVTPINPFGDREEEINRWLNERKGKVDNYIIIDKNSDILNNKPKVYKK